MVHNLKLIQRIYLHHIIFRRYQFIILVGDYSAQAVVNTILANAFPDDKIVGEEDAKDLRVEANSGLRDRVVELANHALVADLALGDNVQWGIGPGSQRTSEQLLEAIDRGNFEGGKSGRTSLPRSVSNHKSTIFYRIVDLGSY